MTVAENLEVGAYLPAARSRLAEGLEQVYGLFPALRAKRPLRAAALSGGEQQMLAVGRALMGRPRFLLLDDPFMGLEPRASAGLGATVRALAARGIGLLLAGQHVRRILALATRAYLLDQGRITAHAPAGDLLHSTHLRRVLLGVG
jgi:branched-chain amino acid transport system ATP-binding protein